MEEDIIEILKAHPNGLTAREIARKLGVPRGDVNSLLYSKLNNRCHIDSSYRWSLIGNVHQNNQDQVPPPDSLLSKICLYYLNCIALDGANKVSVFKDSMFNLDYVEIDKLDVDLSNNETVISFMAETSRLNRKTLYLGYPSSVYTIHSRTTGEQYKRIAPIFLFQISYDAGSCSMMSIPSINMEVLRQYCSNNENEQLHELIRLEDELGLNNPEAEFDIVDIATKLYHVRSWQWQDEINPESLNSTPMADIEKDGIYNKAILLRADAPLYTQGLEHELLELSKLPEESYKGTALYDWVHNTNLQDISVSLNSTQLLEVLPLNIEQSNSIKTALSQNISVITGPPGTGKSQVVTSLIVNLAWQGKKALFSSKNNKAVDVVEQRVNNLTNRPIMLRMGGGNGNNLMVDFFRNMLNQPLPSQEDRAEYKELKNKYDVIQNEIEVLLRNKEEFINLRNELDLVEQDICGFRDDWQDLSTTVKEQDLKLLDNALERSLSLYDKAQIGKQNVIIKLLWFILKKSRVEAYYSSIDDLNNVLREKRRNYKIDKTVDCSKEDIFLLAHKTRKEMHLIVKYNAMLGRFSGLSSLENIDKKIIILKQEQSKIANQLWNLWTKVEGYTIPNSLRNRLGEYISAIDLGAQDDNNLLNRLQEDLRRILPTCAVTSLSARSKVPFMAGMFDSLIIDEASQCDIPSILPLLYRAKSAVVIGDPKQLQHITCLSNQQDRNLLNKYNVNYLWSYNAMSLYDIAASICNPMNIIQLKDHHRCHGDIIEFSNREFYQGTLRIATNYNRLRNGNELGIRWINVSGLTRRPHSGSAHNEKEAEVIVQELKRLVSNNYAGTIGVVTPFKAQADKINRLLESDSGLYSSLLGNNMFLADTVHKFQGDERDLIIFSTVISEGTQPGAITYLKNTGNLFNVAVTRARSTLIVVGDKETCLKSGVSYLEHFVDYVERNKEVKVEDCEIKDWGAEYPAVDGHLSVSEWEKILYSALYKAGIKTHPQYHVDKYYLDLALFYNGKRLDIEVDGERYHRSWNGELCVRDQLRNQRMYELGWDVRRFWVYEIRDRLDWCVEQIKLWMRDE